MRKHTVELGPRTMYVFDRYDAADQEGLGHLSEDHPHSHVAIGRQESQRVIGPFRDVCRSVGHVDSVLEVFGGSGWHGAQFQDWCSPDVHHAWDYSIDCVMSIRESLPMVEASRGDSYTRDFPFRYSWVHADFNNFTLAKWRKDKKLRALVDRMFAHADQFVTITDSAVFGLSRFVQNQQSYGEWFDMDLVGDWKRYWDGADRVYQDTYGFGIRHVVYWHTCCIYILEKGADYAFDKVYYPATKIVEPLHYRHVSTEIVPDVNDIE